MKTHETTVPFRGDGSRALDALVIALASSGFRVEKRSASGIELAGQTEMRSHQSPLAFASRIEVKLTGGHFALRAELGGIERLRRFLLVFPLTLCLGLAVVIGVLLTLTIGPKLEPRFLVPLAVVFGVQIVISTIVRPLVSRTLETRTCAALDALATSIASVGTER